MTQLPLQEVHPKFRKALEAANQVPKCKDPAVKRYAIQRTIKGILEGLRAR